MRAVRRPPRPTVIAGDVARDVDGPTTIQATHVDPHRPFGAGCVRERATIGRERRIDLEACVQRDLARGAERERVGRAAPDAHGDRTQCHEQCGRNEETVEPSPVVRHGYVARCDRLRQDLVDDGRGDVTLRVHERCRRSFDDRGAATVAARRRIERDVRHEREHRRRLLRRRYRRRIGRSDPLGQRDHLVIRRQLELLRQQDLVDPRLLERPDSVARANQRLHQTKRRLAIERVERRQATPPVRRRRVVPPVLGATRESLERRRVIASEPGALAFHPSLEPGSAREMETVEELPLVDRDRPLEISRAERRAKFGDVAVNELRREHEVARSGDRLVASDLMAQRIQRLVETLSRLLLVGVEPEERHESIARDASMAGRGEDGEQREPARLRGRTGNSDAVALEINLT